MWRILMQEVEKNIKVLQGEIGSVITKWGIFYTASQAHWGWWILNPFGIFANRMTGYLIMGFYLSIIGLLIATLSIVWFFRGFYPSQPRIFPYFSRSK
jgi:hypothetical protein